LIFFLDVYVKNLHKVNFLVILDKLIIQKLIDLR
jgi:hypothetical protein